MVGPSPTSEQVPGLAKQCGDLLTTRGHRHSPNPARHSDEIAWIRFGTGHKRNALATQDWRQLAARLNDLGSESKVRAVVLQGTGADFCAGFDIRVWADSDPSEVNDSFRAIEEACTAVECMPVPVVAAIEGVALGAGCQLALACDIRIMSETAEIGMPTSRLGILPTEAFARRLVMHAGSQRAALLLYTGKPIDGRTAREYGIASEVTTDHNLQGFVAQLVDEIADQPRTAIRASKHAIARNVNPNSSLAIQRSGDTEAVSWHDFRNGVDFFLRRSSGPDRGGSYGDAPVTGPVIASRPAANQETA